MDFLSKADLIAAYGVRSARSFEKMIGTAGMTALNWKRGRQHFSPKQLRDFYEVVGKPLKREEKYV